MQWILFLLILMVLGQCSSFTCQLYEYHFIEEGKTWTEAQTYCRETYTDLATVFDMTDMKRLADSVKKGEAWIGLYNEPGGNKKWHWSLPGVEYYENETWWNNNDPHDKGGVENCVVMNTDHKWSAKRCSDPYNYAICYDEPMKSKKKFPLINKRMTWPEAQKHCRDRYTDLISGYDQLEDPSVEIPQGYHSWIGLFRDTWRWSDGSHSSFRNWENHGGSNYEESNKKCAVFKESQKFSSQNCDGTKPFVCYDDKVILINQNKTWDEALNYCRKNYKDLASITDQNQQRWIQDRVKKASTPFVWLGLRYTCTLNLWFWVSDDLVCYDNWASNLEPDSCDKSAAMQREEQHKWVKKADTEAFNFICVLP